MNTYEYLLYVPNRKLYGHLEVLGSLFLITILQWNSGEVATTITPDDVQPTSAVLVQELFHAILPKWSSPQYTQRVPMLETTSNSSIQPSGSSQVASPLLHQV
jgi:hypothetical protein